MDPENRSSRKARIAITIVAIAALGLVAAPTATAFCVPNNGSSPADACWTIDPFHPEGEYVCITNQPTQNCIP